MDPDDADHAATGPEQHRQHPIGSRERVRSAKRRELAAHERAPQVAPEWTANVIGTSIMSRKAGGRGPPADTRTSVPAEITSWS